MHEVATIGDGADGHERPQREEPLHWPGGLDRGQDDRARDQGVGNEAAPVPEQVLGLRGGDEGQHQNQGEHARGLDADPGAVAQERASPGHPPQPHQGTDQQLGGPHVGAEVEPGRPCACGSSKGSGRCPASSDGERRRPRTTAGNGAPPPSLQRERGGAQQREHQVELLLDRQRPEVQQRRLAAERGAVLVAGGHEPPVGHIGQGADGVAPQLAQLAGVAQPERGHHDGEDGDQRGREQPADPPTPEGTERDVAVVLVLDREQAGDQEAAEGEEGGDGQEPARRQPDVGVHHEDGQQGHCPQAVEAGFVGDALGLQVRRLALARRVRIGDDGDRTTL